MQHTEFHVHFIYSRSFWITGNKDSLCCGLPFLKNTGCEDFCPTYEPLNVIENVSIQKIIDGTGNNASSMNPDGFFSFQLRNPTTLPKNEPVLKKYCDKVLHVIKVRLRFCEKNWQNIALLLYVCRYDIFE